MSDVGLLGWITPKLIAHDQHARGLIARVLGASTQNRQAIYAALAHEGLHGVAPDAGLFQSNFDAACERAMRLRNCPAPEIIRAVYGNVPEGYLGALERCGNAPLKPESYVRLFEIFRTHDRPKIEALRYVGEITDEVLEVLFTLSPPLVNPKVLARTDDVFKATALNDAIACIQQINSQATDEAITEAVRQLGEKSELKTMVSRFVKRADRLPPQPLPADDELVPLDTVPALIAASRKYQNCMRRYIGRVIHGATAFAEYQERLILEFKPLADGGWLLEDVHTLNNARVSPEDRKSARDKCAAGGVSHVRREFDGPEGWRGVEIMIQGWGWSLD